MKCYLSENWHIFYKQGVKFNKPKNHDCKKGHCEQNICIE